MTDLHVLHPGHLPTPFTADEIRRACQPGRTVRALVEEDGGEPYVHVTRFVAATEEGAEEESWNERPDGSALSERVRRRSTWLEFQEHASFPAVMTSIAEEDVEIPAGRFEMLRYTQRDGSAVRTFWFAKSAPGMPLRFEEWDEGRLVYRSTALENLPADPGST
jgi:hypothetical protein